MTYSRPEGGTEHESTCAGADGLARARIVLVCWAKDSDTADELADAVRRCLQEKYPMLGNGQHVIRTQEITLLATGEIQAERGEGSGDFFDGVVLPFRITYDEAIGV